MLLPLAGCKGHSEEPTDGYRSAIQLQVTPRTLATGARAITDGQDPEVPGIAPEDEIRDGQLFIGEDFGLTASRSFTPDPKDGNKWSAKFEEKLEDLTSRHRIAAVINSSRLGLRGSDYTSESTVSLADIDRMIGESFLMSSTFDNKDNNFYRLSKDECTDVPLDVERVVSKVQLRRAKEMTGKEMQDTYGFLQPGQMTWTIAGSAKSAYLFTDHAGSLHLGDDGLYEGLKTFSAKEKVKGGYDLMKLSDKEGHSENFKARSISTFESGKVEGNDGGRSTKDGIYFLEHALNETNKTKAGTPYDKSVTYKDVTYVKIYTGLTSIKGFRIDNDKVTFSRHKVYPTKESAIKGFAVSDPVTTSPELLDQQLLKDINAKETSTDHRWYWVDVTDTKWFKGLTPEEKAKLKEGKDYYTTDGKASTRSFLLVHDQPTTFYYGIDDHTIYDTLLAARAGGNSKIRKYEGGKMVYLSPLNEQRTTEKGPVFNCDTRRNNIYDLILNSITGLGLNYDPVDPDDPNIPEPGDNPWEPEPNIPPINGRENVIRITATPLQWNTMDHTLELM